MTLLTDMMSARLASLFIFTVAVSARTVPLSFSPRLGPREAYQPTPRYEAEEHQSPLDVRTVRDVFTILGVLSACVALVITVWSLLVRVKDLVMPWLVPNAESSEFNELPLPVASQSRSISPRILGFSSWTVPHISRISAVKPQIDSYVLLPFRFLILALPFVGSDWALAFPALLP